MSSHRTVALAREIASDVRRLRPDWQNPERYFEDRSEIEIKLRQLARALES